MAFLVHAGLNFWHFLIDLIHKSITYFKTLKTKTAAAETKLRFFCLFSYNSTSSTCLDMGIYCKPFTREKEVQQRIKGLLLCYFGRGWDGKNGNYNWAFLVLQSLLHKTRLLAHFFLGFNHLLTATLFLKLSLQFF